MKASRPGPRSTGPVELRVHGVSGTPPESLLDREDVFQVAGDNRAGVYVPTLDSERFDLRPRPDAPSVPTEVDLRGYTWGGLTSGSPGRALWLLLTPFTLLNVAIRARPTFSTAAHPRLTGWLWALTRLLGLAMTLLFVLTGVGLGHWLCQAGSCPPGAPTIPFVGSSPRAVFIVGALLPIVALALVGIASWWSTSYETVTAIVTDGPGQEHPVPPSTSHTLEVGLGEPAMWQNTATVRGQRSAHLLAGVALAAIPLVDQILVWRLALPLLAMAYAIVRVCAPGLLPRWAGRLAWGLAWVALAWGVLGGGGTDSSLVAIRSTGDFGLLAGVLVLLVLAVLGALALTNAVAQRAAGEPTAAAPMARQVPAFRGLTTTVMACMGAFLAAIFSGGVYLYGAAYLRTGALRPDLSQVANGDGVPEPTVVRLGSTAYTVGAGLLVLIVAVFAILTLARRGGPHTEQAFSRDYGDPGPSSPDRTRFVRRALYMGTVVDRTPALLTAMLVGGFVSLAWSAWIVYGNRDLLWWSPADVAGAGAFAAVYTLIGLVALGALAFRVPATRRSVGILWDVASFWPRTAHPLGAPCYAERTVPDLVTQVSWLSAGEGRRVVVAAHSQGTVICAAAIRQLKTLTDATTLDRVHLLTFGCVLRRLYGRYFPAYFGPDQLQAVYSALGGGVTGTAEPRWVNLWRYTDYLGGQVTAGPPQVIPEAPAPGDIQHGPQDWEWHTPDPPQYAHEPGLTTYAPPLRHSDFWRDASGYFQKAVAELATRAPVPGEPQDNPAELPGVPAVPVV